MAACFQVVFDGADLVFAVALRVFDFFYDYFYPSEDLKMRNNLEMKKQSGFTLIEIAIVMVIIGLLIGGVLKGQALIDNAKIKAVINDMNGVQAAWYGYYDRKHAYPSADTSLTTTAANQFTQQTRTEGLLVGNPVSTATAINAMGGHTSVTTSSGVADFAGAAVCTSVLQKYAQGIDAGLDDGIATSGSVRGFSDAAFTIDQDVTGGTAVPLTAAYATAGYVTLCKTL